MVNTDGGGIEEIFFITASLDCMRFARILLLYPLSPLLWEEVCGFDDGGVAVTLDGLEVRPVLGDHLCFPPSGADGNQNIERQALRGTGRQWP